MRAPAEARALSGALAESGISAGVLQGTGNAAEEKVLDQLDSRGGVVIALHPAGREIVRSASGSAPPKIVVAELHDSRRHLARICRALATDSYEMLLSLEDEAVVAQLGPAATGWARLGLTAGGELPDRRSRWLVALAQRKAERSGTAVRQEIILRDRQLDDLLAFSGKRE